MSEPSPIAAMPVPRPAPDVRPKDVRGAIARAAAATGTDFSYLMAQARLESGLDPKARAATSSAAGLYQFTGQTWLSMLDKHGAELGIASGSSDPASRAQLLALRSDPELSALMAGQLANDNRDFLAGILGRDPDASELYLAHFLGAEGAGRFLGALSTNPSQSAAALLPKAAAANRGVFFGPAGARSVGEVMDLLRTRMGQAMNAPDVPLPAYAAEAPQGGPIQQAFHAAANAPDAPPARSMADTLREAFALSTPGTAPAHVRAAYGQLRSLGI